jgi:hypothetical protein
MIKSIRAWCIFFEAMSEQPETERAEWLRLWLSHSDGLSCEESDKWNDFATLTPEQQRQAIISLIATVKQTRHPR